MNSNTEQHLSKLISKLEKIDNYLISLRKAEKKALEKNQIKKSLKLKDEIKKVKAEGKEVETEIKAIKKNSDSWNYNNTTAVYVENLNVFYGQNQSLTNINVEFPKNKIIAIIGPSGCGKSTFLRTLNRINDEIPSFKAKGKVIIDGKYDIFKLRNIFDPSDKISLPQLRNKVGIIFQQPNPFPMSVYKNVAYGPKINGIKNEKMISNLVISSLKKSAIYDEVKDNLKLSASSLSGGQQQRLCIARAIANKPEILLMDEPTSALDPIAASKVEELILELKKDYTIIMVTHSLQQAARISDYTAYFYQGKLIEFNETNELFKNPKHSKTEDYIRGRFG